MAVEIAQSHAGIRVDQPALRRCLQRCLNHMNFRQAEVSVLLTDDADIRGLNQQHRGQDQPTDILSFSMREYRSAQDPLPPHPELLGDLVISLETVARQARERGVSTQEELHFIAIHGLLHLLGYDHADAMEAMRMNNYHQSLMALCHPPGRKGRV